MCQSCQRVPSSVGCTGVSVLSASLIFRLRVGCTGVSVLSASPIFHLPSDALVCQSCQRVPSSVGCTGVSVLSASSIFRRMHWCVSLVSESHLPSESRMHWCVSLVSESHLPSSVGCTGVSVLSASSIFRRMHWCVSLVSESHLPSESRMHWCVSLVSEFHLPSDALVCQSCQRVSSSV